MGSFAFLLGPVFTWPRDQPRRAPDAVHPPSKPVRPRKPANLTAVVRLRPRESSRPPVGLTPVRLWRGLLRQRGRPTAFAPVRDDAEQGFELGRLREVVV